MDLREHAQRLGRYGAVGILTNLTLYVAFVALLWMGLGPALAAGICYVTSVVFSYILNRNWSFSSTASHRSDLPKYLTAYGLGFCVTLITMSILPRYMAAEIAQLFNIGITAVFIYLSLWALRFGTTSGT